ncbi:uncharacterized protein LOC127046975 [Gopherus flavomarginatus]|uniref:uncharacterized protein LOC127046975 n=1 Tax=Gopherus flavomarginatus TaxID=286002 RepID=UPI0021CC05A8|nr:uncharacterized protein LOC127046975 [Gopherus flavomarginatus]
MEPHFSKAALVESIAELTENLPMVPEPTSIISSSMAAVCSLSKLKPLLALELESRLLWALLYIIFTMGTGQDTTHFQHVQFWLHSKNAQQRARAIWSSAAPLQFATSLPGFDLQMEDTGNRWSISGSLGHRRIWLSIAKAGDQQIWADSTVFTGSFGGLQESGFVPFSKDSPLGSTERSMCTKCLSNLQQVRNAVTSANKNKPCQRSLREANAHGPS